MARPSSIREQIKTKLSSVPRMPGVYIFKGLKEKVLYVGKAKNLRTRLSSYFQKSSNLDARKAAMVEQVRDFSYVVTSGELEALALEANLIKQYRPRFNVLLRDDKNYPYLRLTLNDEWPRLEVARRVSRDGSVYFGPYVPSAGMREAIDFIRRNFHIRPCRYRLDKPMRPCVQYEMGRCEAPCAGLVSRDAYMSEVEEVIMFLKGKSPGLLKDLEERMKKLSDEMQYEEAARMRDRIAALESAWESQKVIAPELGDLDVIAAYHKDGSPDAVVQVFFIRNGIMIGTRDLKLRDVAGIPMGELLHGFLMMFYSRELLPPGQVLLNAKPDERDNLEAWLRDRVDRKVTLGVPMRGKKRELVEMAADNARVVFESSHATGEGPALSELTQRLGLSFIPRSIGAFDVSNIQGSEPVAAYVHWEDGEFLKDRYRHLHIQGVSGVNDYAMMKEAVHRVLVESDDPPRPDLIIIDGGRTHLEAALDAVRNVHGIPEFISVAKRPDRAFGYFLEEPLNLEGREASSLLLKRIRDEVHRFAITFHKKTRAKRTLTSPLEGIPGIGKSRRVALLRTFGSIDALRGASVEDIAAVKGMTRPAAEKVKEALGEG